MADTGRVAQRCQEPVHHSSPQHSATSTSLATVDDDDDDDAVDAVDDDDDRDDDYGDSEHADILDNLCRRQSSG